MTKKVKSALNTILCPGKQLCQHCDDYFQSAMKETIEQEIDTLSQNFENSTTTTSSLSTQGFIPTPIQVENIDNVLNYSELSPIKIEKYRLDKNQTKLKRKLSELNAAVQSSVMKKLKFDDDEILKLPALDS